MATPTPIARDTSQTERAVLRIRDLVLRGEFKAGERLAELPLVQLLGVSRTPIRTALQKLAEEGLIEAAQPTGYLVRSFTEAEIFDAIEVRGTIEALAARMAAERGVPRPLMQDIRDCLAALDAALDEEAPQPDKLQQFTALNRRFHAMLLVASGSDMVGRALERVTSLPFASPDAFVAAQARIPGSLEILHRAQVQHREIVDAIEARSSARVEPLVREHARIARRNLELVLRDRDAVRHLVGATLIRRPGIN